jgi:hypothetical protein
MHSIHQRDSTEAGLQKRQIEIIQMSAPQNYQLPALIAAHQRLGHKFPAGIQMPLPSRSTPPRAMADSDLSG